MSKFLSRLIDVVMVGLLIFAASPIILWVIDSGLFLVYAALALVTGRMIVEGFKWLQKRLR